MKSLTIVSNNFSKIIVIKRKNFSDIFLSNLTYQISINLIDLYEEKIIKYLFFKNYNLFENLNNKKIIKSTMYNLNLQSNRLKKIQIIQTALLNYLSSSTTNKVYLNLDGILNFRLKNYIDFVNLILENTITKYLIKKEYSDYIKLLQKYVSKQKPQTGYVHLIYNDTTKKLLNEHNLQIELTHENPNYLSDISFSSNDYLLNSILKLLPKHLYIHTNKTKDNFINSLKKIYKSKFTLCKKCNICSNH